LGELELLELHLSEQEMDQGLGQQLSEQEMDQGLGQLGVHLHPS
jgi:hypothetical protein